MGAALIGFLAGRGNRWPRAAPCLVAAVLLVKPVHVFAFLPARAAALSAQPQIRQIDEAAPAGTIFYIISDAPDSDRSGELADFGFYSCHRVLWPRHLDAVLAAATSDVYCLVTPDALERITKRFGGAAVRLVTVQHRSGEMITLLRISNRVAEFL